MWMKFAATCQNLKQIVAQKETQEFEKSLENMAIVDTNKNVPTIICTKRISRKTGSNNC